MTKGTITLTIALSLCAALASPFQVAGQDSAAKKAQQDTQAVREAEIEGTLAELAAIGGFRGARSNTIMGYGLVVGLSGTGDSRQIAATTTAMANALSRWGTLVDPASFKAKNIAIVSVTAELPPFMAPGRKIDITVQSLGDAKSLEGGVLLPTTLGTMWDSSITYAVASGAVSIGGFNAGSGGNTVRKNHTTVGRVPNGGDVQRSVDTQFVFDGNAVYFDLDTPDFTTAKRVADKIQEALPGTRVTAEDAVSVRIEMDDASQAVTILAQIEKLEVRANTVPTVVINERTGTIVIGGNVRLGPAVIAHGSLRVRIDTQYDVSQPAPLSGGATVVTPRTTVDAEEEPTQIAVITPNATLDDLAKILQTLNVSARDIIAILQALSEQGALKARIRIQ